MIDDSLNYIKESMKRAILVCMIGILLVSCASMGTPGGGEYDFDPPALLKSTPDMNSLNVNDKKIEIVFDELVQIEKAMDKVIVTPPQRNFPIIRAQNNKVIVELKDTLKSNTTYTIDFTDAIVDNNEKNPLENFALSFSTGDVLDTLAISGKVLAANNLEPVAGMYVGIHSDLSDTAFTKTPFLRISRTNELGNFSIKGVAPGKYRIYALDDQNRDYKYDDPAEAIAFEDSVIIPSSIPAVRYDSIFNKKTFLFDSLKQVSYTRFLPDNVVLRSFTSLFKRQYLQKSERLTDDIFTLYFGAATQMPEVEALDVPVKLAEWSVLEKTIGNDTLKYWLTKPTMVEMDTIALKVSYFETDTLSQLQMRTDTLKLVNRNREKQRKEEEKLNKEREKKKELPEPIFLQIKTNLGNSFDVYRSINIEFDYPPADFDKSKIRLQHKQDSVFRNIDFEITADSLNPRKYQIKKTWTPEGEYQFAIDSANVFAHNGLCNNKLETPFKIKALDKYGALDLNIQNLPNDVPAFVELLDKSDNAVRKATVRNSVATFLYLDPGTYYARITIDANENGKWDPGEFSEGRVPELVIYYDRFFEIKEYWDIEEDWNIASLPLDKQKPLDITKNKPKDDAKRKREMQQRDSRNQRNNKSQQNNNTGNSGYSNNNNNNNSYNRTY